jgi:hypothetical protein
MNSDIKQLKVSLIVDSEYISKWEYDAIVYASARSEFKIDSVLYCLNSVSYRQYFKHFFYFALNLVSMRNKWTKRTKWSTLIPDKNRVKRFEAETNGRWQSIPQGIREWLDTSTPDVILKFGMNLLSDPQNLPSKFGVLSFHHGNPTKYRGRPAGFYEILFKEDEIGVIVQRLTNSLDGGEIVSSGNFKLFKHSYKRSLENAYGSGRYLLLKALNNLENHISPDSLGKIYTLPTNYQVANFVLKLLLQKLKWIIGVMFFRKKWSISTWSWRRMHGNLPNSMQKVMPYCLNNFSAGIIQSTNCLLAKPSRPQSLKSNQNLFESMRVANQVCAKAMNG